MFCRLNWDTHMTQHTYLLPPAYCWRYQPLLLLNHKKTNLAIVAGQCDSLNGLIGVFQMCKWHLAGTFIQGNTDSECGVQASNQGRLIVGWRPYNCSIRQCSQKSKKSYFFHSFHTPTTVRLCPIHLPCVQKKRWHSSVGFWAISGQRGLWGLVSLQCSESMPR